MSTLRNMSNWVEKERFGLPEYLLRACPASLREGRRLKTKFRLGCHDLRSSSCRMQLVRNAQCPISAGAATDLGGDEFSRPLLEWICLEALISPQPRTHLTMPVSGKGGTPPRSKAFLAVNFFEAPVRPAWSYS